MTDLVGGAKEGTWTETKAMAIAMAKVMPPCAARGLGLCAVPGDGFLQCLLMRRGGGAECCGELAVIDDIGFFEMEANLGQTHSCMTAYSYKEAPWCC